MLLCYTPHQMSLIRLVGLTIGFFLLNLTMFAQTRKNIADVTVNIDPPAPAIVETQPEYPGGFGKMESYLRQINYPKVAAENRVRGRVLISFLIDSTGQLSNIKVLKGLGYGCDEEALRAVRHMPHWKPATRDGKAIATTFALPILFSPEK